MPPAVCGKLATPIAHRERDLLPIERHDVLARTAAAGAPSGRAPIARPMPDSSTTKRSPPRRQGESIARVLARSRRPKATRPRAHNLPRHAWRRISSMPIDGHGHQGELALLAAGQVGLATQLFVKVNAVVQARHRCRAPGCLPRRGAGRRWPFAAAPVAPAPGQSETRAGASR
jgi:hypothetical protein